MKPSPSLSRRDFLKLAARALLWLTGLLGLGGLVRYFSFRPDPGPADEFDLGPAGDYPPGTRLLRLDIPALIENRDGELRATSLTCTHLGCTVDPDDEGFACPCHGSRYDRNGQVLVGPARQALARLRIAAQEDGTLLLYTEEEHR